MIVKNEINGRVFECNRRFNKNLSKGERGLHPTVRVKVNFIDFNPVDFEYIV